MQIVQSPTAQLRHLHFVQSVTALFHSFPKKTKLYSSLFYQGKYFLHSGVRTIGGVGTSIRWRAWNRTGLQRPSPHISSAMQPISCAPPHSTLIFHRVRWAGSCESWAKSMLACFSEVKQRRRSQKTVGYLLGRVALRRHHQQLLLGLGDVNVIITISFATFSLLA